VDAMESVRIRYSEDEQNDDCGEGKTNKFLYKFSCRQRKMLIQMNHSAVSFYIRQKYLSSGAF
jgi:hypothetical protein